MCKCNPIAEADLVRKDDKTVVAADAFSIAKCLSSSCTRRSHHTGDVALTSIVPLHLFHSLYDNASFLKLILMVI